MLHPGFPLCFQSCCYIFIVPFNSHIPLLLWQLICGSIRFRGKSQQHFWPPPQVFKLLTSLLSPQPLTITAPAYVSPPPPPQRCLQPWTVQKRQGKARICMPKPQECHYPSLGCICHPSHILCYLICGRPEASVYHQWHCAAEATTPVWSIALTH